MTFLSRWRAGRRQREEQAVITAIGMLRPSRASGYPIHRLSRLGPGRVFAVLARLEGSGRVTSDWVPGPYPRRRVYKVVPAAVSDD